MKLPGKRFLLKILKITGISIASLLLLLYLLPILFPGTIGEKVKGWAKPAGGYIHALHEGEWGGFHYRITGKDDNGKLLYEGGWQNNRPAPMNEKHRFVENIFHHAFSIQKS